MKKIQYFTAGEFAKLHNISKQTLLFYDKIDLFSPSFVDPNNGYRYYDATQLEVLDTIFILKEIGVSLQEIKQYLSKRSTTQAIEMLKLRKKELDEKIDLAAKISSRLTAKLDTLQVAENISKTDSIEYAYQQEKYLYCHDVESPYNLLYTDMAIKKLLHDLTENKVSYNYQIGVTIPIEHLEKEMFLEANRVFSTLYQPIDSPNLLIRPSGLYATFYHLGSYRAAGETYKKFLKQIATDSYEVCSCSYEDCLIDSLSSKQESDYLTRISLLVKSKG